MILGMENNEGGVVRGEAKADVTANILSPSINLDGLGKAIGPLSDAVAGLMNDILRPGAKVAGGAIEDYVKARRLSRWVKLLEGFKAKCEKAGVDPAKLPESMLLPGMEAAKDVDDPDLQEMWQQLMANAAANESAQQPLYIDTLKRLSPADARVFRQFVTAGHVIGMPETEGDQGRERVARLESMGLVGPHYTIRVPAAPSQGGRTYNFRDEAGERHRFAPPQPTTTTVQSPRDLTVDRASVGPTTFGVQFHRAVTGRRATPSNDGPPAGSLGRPAV